MACSLSSTRGGALFVALIATARGADLDITGAPARVRFLNAADAENAGIEPRLTKAFDEVQRVLQRDWNQSMLLSRPRPDVAHCTGKKCVGVKGRIRGREFDRSDTTPYFERGGAVQCVPNATLLVESVPHLVNFSTTSKPAHWTLRCTLDKTCTLENAVRRYWENCMDWRILLWPTGAPPPDMWAVK